MCMCVCVGGGGGGYCVKEVRTNLRGGGVGWGNIHLGSCQYL